jgi:hypothetical protein
MSALVVAESLFVNTNAVDTMNALAVVGLGAVGIGALILAFRRHTGAAITMGIIAILGLGYMGMSGDAVHIASAVGRVIKGMIPS